MLLLIHTHEISVSPTVSLIGAGRSSFSEEAIPSPYRVFRTPYAACARFAGRPNGEESVTPAMR